MTSASRSRSRSASATASCWARAGPSWSWRGWERRLGFGCPPPLGAARVCWHASAMPWRSYSPRRPRRIRLARSVAPPRDKGGMPDYVARAMGRLGWIDAPRDSLAHWGSLLRFAEEARRDGLGRIVVCGMGGSSLAPQALAASFGNDFPPALDRTDPAAVVAVQAAP